MLRFSVTMLAVLLWIVLLVSLVVAKLRSPGPAFRSIHMFKRFRRRLRAAKLPEEQPAGGEPKPLAVTVKGTEPPTIQIPDPAPSARDARP